MKSLGTDARDTSLPDSRDAYRIFQPANVNWSICSGWEKKDTEPKPVPDSTRILRNESHINLTFFFWTFIFPFKIIYWEFHIQVSICHSSSSPLPPHMHPNSSNRWPLIFQLYVCRFINKPSEITQCSQVFRADLSGSANLQAGS